MMNIPLKPMNINMLTRAKINIKAVSCPRWLSTYFPAIATDIKVPIPNISDAILIPPLRLMYSTRGEI